MSILPYFLTVRTNVVYSAAFPGSTDLARLQCVHLWQYTNVYVCIFILINTKFIQMYTDTTGDLQILNNDTIISMLCVRSRSAPVNPLRL